MTTKNASKNASATKTVADLAPAAFDAMALASCYAMLKIPADRLTPKQAETLAKAGLTLAEPTKKGLLSVCGRIHNETPSRFGTFLNGRYTDANKQAVDGRPIVGVFVDGKPLMAGQMLRMGGKVSYDITCK